MKPLLLLLVMLSAFGVSIARNDGFSMSVKEVSLVIDKNGSYVVLKCLSTEYRFYFFHQLPDSCCVMKYDNRILVTEPRCTAASKYIRIPVNLTDGSPMYIVGRCSRTKSCLGFRVIKEQKIVVHSTNDNEQKTIDQRSANMLVVPTNQPNAIQESNATVSSSVPELKRDPEKDERQIQDKTVGFAVLYDQSGGQINNFEDNALGRTSETEQGWSDDKRIEEKTKWNNRGEEYINVGLPIVLLALIVCIYFVFFQVYFWSHAPF
ncbi:hypothetical protein PRIPAC_96673 [Pristionchus pacificus]|uniref:Uncharacterized protein n=1 Tax=Pristionchus pacificus TaxID=54126 RepID=A0A2A6CU72_PRIPA|nr:hypothetical protein PRIPAC_96673 [Pristionchus pacificus]|eukprot:PDM81581.1 hypothetical protein PRIPAC_30562 [Pristionchus pacificus]